MRKIVKLWEECLDLIKTKEIWKNKLDQLHQVNYPVYLASFAILFLTLGCRPSREEIEITLWRNNLPLPVEYCVAGSPLLDYGYYRRLNSGKLEFISFCNPAILEFLSIQKNDLQNLLDKYVPKTVKVKN